MTPAELLHVYDDEVRRTFADHVPAGWTCERDGPLVRCRTNRGGMAMLAGDASRLDVHDLAAVVERTVAYFGTDGTEFEWKTYDHDRADLIPLLLAAGAEADEHEALVLGEAAPLAVEPVLPDHLAIRQVTDRSDFERIASMQSEVWNDDWSWLAADLGERVHGDEEIHVFVVEDGDLVVSAAWLVPVPGTAVAGLWGGSTLADYRGRGIYRALVARRAQLAIDLGYSILQVDASDDSRPILERLGLTVVGGTTPYVIGR